MTGGNGGIGKGIATGFARAGAQVVIAARNEEKTTGAVAELEAEGHDALGLACNVTDRESVATAIAVAAERFGGLDILVNNAGTNIRSEGPEDLPPEGGMAAGPAGTTLSARTLRDFKERSERAFIVAKLREQEWNVLQTAKAIETPRSNLYKKIEQYGISQEKDG